MKKFFTVTLAIILFQGALSAQFYEIGIDPIVPWNQASSKHYTVIYPRGLDSLAQLYTVKLEDAYRKVGLTTKYLPSQYWFFNRKTPVILHPYTVDANGSVGVSPVRIDLLTQSNPYNAVPLPWMDLLAIHESRHLSQIQNGMDGWLRPFNYIVGEGSVAFNSGLYNQSYYIEGDAVVTETAWSNSGRGRSADFLNYYMMAFDQNYDRTFWHWLCGSPEFYIPDQYAFGYLNIATWRTMFDEPYLMANLLRMHHRNPFLLNMGNAYLKRTTGKKGYQWWPEVVEFNRQLFRENIASRAPFMQGEDLVTLPNHMYTKFSGMTTAIDHKGGESLFAIRYSFRRPWQLVRIDTETCKVHVVRQFSHESSALEYDPETSNLYWSESVLAGTKNLRTWSKIYRYNTQTQKFDNFTKSGHSYYNPAASDLGIVAVEYFFDSRTQVVVLDRKTAKPVRVIPVPDGIQACYADYNDGTFYMTGLTDGGYALYKLADDNTWKAIWDPQPVKLTSLWNSDGVEYVESDRSGVNELYRLEGDHLVQVTSCRYGSDEFAVSLSGKELYYTEISMRGTYVRRVSLDTLASRPVEMSKMPYYHLAETVARQDRQALEDARAGKGVFGPESEQLISKVTRDKNKEYKAIVAAVADSTVTEFQPKKYHRIAHLSGFHSWVPLYVDQDAISNLSGAELSLNMASLGAMAFFQNTLGSSTGSVAYSAHKDPYDPSMKWRHSAILNWAYTGILPEFSLRVGFNERGVHQYDLLQYPKTFTIGSKIYETSGDMALRSRYYDKPSLEAKLNVAIPFAFRAAGWNSGVRPSATYTISNDMFSLASVSDFVPQNIEPLGDELPRYQFVDNPSKSRQIMPYQTLQVRCMAYCTQYTPNNAVYPRFGASLEIGGLLTPGLMKLLQPTYYIYGHIYLPFVLCQGFKISVLAQKSFGNQPLDGLSLVSLPRGFKDIGQKTTGLERDKLISTTVDWGIPISTKGWNLFNVFYIAQFRINPFFDYTNYGKKGLDLFSTGSEFTVGFRKFIFKINLNVGIRYAYNFGNFEGCGIDPNAKHHHVAPVISVNF